jgi:deoxyribose-phosphate aldolase
MRKILPDDIRIKFSGGIRNYNQIKELSSFVDRIGTSIIIS